MSAFSGVSNFFAPRPLWQVAEDQDYSADNVLVLRGDIEGLQRLFPQTYANIMGCVSNRDKRTPVAYARDLVASWLYEDYFMSHIESDVFSILLNGSDRKRIILPSSRVSSDSDYMLDYGNGTIPLELMNSYDGFVEENGILHLRNDKYTKLVNSGSLFLVVMMNTRKFALIDFRDPVNARRIESYKPYGGKSVYEVAVNGAMIHDITPRAIETQIELLLGF